MIRRRDFVMSGALIAAGQAVGIETPDWDVGAPETSGMRAGDVADTLNTGESLPGLRALLVSHRGVLVAERYYAGAPRWPLQIPPPVAGSNSPRPGHWGVSLSRLSP